MRNAFASFALSTLAFAGQLHAQATITDGTLIVTVNDVGVLTAIPAGGLETFEGRLVELHAGQAEWFGVSYDDSLERVEYVGAGLEADWAAGRQPVRPLRFYASGDEAVAVVLAGDLEITTRFHFDPDGANLLWSATLTNVGTRTIDDIFFTREWRTPGEAWSFPDDLALPLTVGTDVCRHAWMFGEMPPGRTVGAGSAMIALGTADTRAAGPGVDVPLTEWLGGSWPTGLTVGRTNGISFGDYDADGWTDMFALQGGNLIRNVNGQDWQIVANLKALLPYAQYRYGSSFGDYDNDGLPDIACSPRNSGGDTCIHLFQNLGGGPNFMDIATDPTLMDLQACGAESESLCWGDVDGDGDMDLFVPVYPAWHGGGPGNFFYYNLGPVAAGGAYAFQESITTSGLDNPPGTSRPEGAQFVDTDFDGDFDLYSNGTLYRNVSTPGVPLFDDPTANTGILFTTSLEEGIVFFDKDLDGDYDLFIVFTQASLGVRVFEAKGDGSFEMLPTSTVASFQTGLNLGISAADWDGDGDQDFTTRGVFRRNQYVETGAATFTVATDSIPASHVTSATPAWGDWDRDGDLDCALGNWLSVGHFYENTTYDASTPASARRYARVRVMRDSASVPAGLEAEYGASVELHVAGEADLVRRKDFVSSSGGYLNQDEYVLQLALPADPTPTDPVTDLEFDVTVDLSGPPSAGFLRIDKHVNPVLGGVKLAQLADREITVFRSGKVILDGCVFDPVPAQSIAHQTTTGGLVSPTPTAAVPALAAVGAGSYVGLDFDTLFATGPVRVTELIIDGQLDAAVSCASGTTNVTLWDVSVAGSPTVVPGGLLERMSHASNDRSYYRCNLVLPPGRTYRLVAAVLETRGTPIAAPVTTGAITVNGGLSFTDLGPCSGLGVEAAGLDPTAVAMAIRFSADPGADFVDLGYGLAGAAGIPNLTGSGSLVAGAPVGLDLTGAAPGAPALLAIGFSADCATLYGATVVPALDGLLYGIFTSAAGTLSVNAAWPAGVPAGRSFYFQMAVLDAGALAGVAFSNAVVGSSQP